MKHLGILLLFLGGFVLTAHAKHIAGGEIYYTLKSTSGNQYTYHVVLKLFRRCDADRDLNNSIVIGVFNRSTYTRIQDYTVSLTKTETINLSDPDPCITNPPTVCFVLGYYEFDLTLSGNADGYILAAQANYRVEGMNNLSSGYSNIGASYTAEIPGTSVGTTAPSNNSAQFTGNDLEVICASNSFTYSFAATDPDGDELRYSFCNAYQSGVTTSGGGNEVTSPVAPPYSSVPYGSGYSGSVPLGSTVQINSSTGLISGVAPTSGTYVITVCVEEIRNGVVIATQRKDLQVYISACYLASASILPEYQLCKTSTDLQVANISNSPLIDSYNWEIFDQAGAPVYSSTTTTLSYTFQDTGLYTIKLVTNRGEDCSDSTTSLARVYPGFEPAFSYSGICYEKPTVFTDLTTSVYGTPYYWAWDFGETSITTDVSDEQNPSYTYPSMGTKNVQLIAGDDKGCIDTVYQSVTIMDKPPLSVAFADTLICVPDKVQLEAIGSGSFSWTPATAITDINTATPTVNPVSTTSYYVTLNDNGCINTDSVQVRVTDHVELEAMADTVICQGDTVQLHVVSDGLQYSWTPASQFINPLVANPYAFTSATTTYSVTASIGSCSTMDEVVVQTVPYPTAIAGADTIICYNAPAFLHGTTDGSSVQWTPASSLDDATILDPVASPEASTYYILYAYDTKGCPKPGTDTILVSVLPDIDAFAGNDTAAVVGQPLQLQATGNEVAAYSWTPGTGLSDTAIANPLAVYNTSSRGINYTVVLYNEAGCSDTAYLLVKVYNTLPSVFVPNAFTPNGDGKNDLLRPIAVGIARIEYFTVYNRWGQRIFSTTINGDGWDGTIGGKLQSSGSYVWVVKAIDYNGLPYAQKGTFVLIR